MNIGGDMTPYEICFSDIISIEIFIIFHIDLKQF